MNIDNAISTALREDGDRVQLSADIKADLQPPYFLWTHIAGEHDRTLAGPSGAREVVIQLDAWALDEATAASMIDRGVAKLESATTFDVQRVTVSGAPTFEFDTKWHRRSCDITIWYQR